MSSPQAIRHPLKRFFQSRTARDNGGGPARLHSGRVFILPTRTGVGFGVLLLVMFVGAVNYNNNLAYGLTFLLASLALVTMHQTHRNLTGLALRSGDTRSGFSGQTVAYQVWLAGEASFERVGICIEAGDSEALCFHVPPGEPVSGWITRPARNRGVQPLGRLTVSTRFPLGLFRAWSNVELGLEALVYPRPAAPGRPLPQSPRRATDSGDQGRGTDDFRGFRTYHPGDSLRHVNWKAVAREQGWHTKEFGGDRLEELWLDWDALPDLDREARLRQLCRWVLDAFRDQRFIGLRLPGNEYRPAPGPAQRDRCLAALARFESPG